MTSDYQRDYDDGYSRNPLGDSLSPGYADGRAARDRLDAPEYSGPSGMQIAGAAMAEEYRQGKVRFYLHSLAQTVAASLVVGALAGGLAIVTNNPPMQWALVGGGIAAAVYLGILALVTLGLAIGYLFVLLLMPFVLWRWLLVFGGAAAIAGYVLAGNAGKTSALVEQQAIEFGIVGMGVGFFLGLLYRLAKPKPRRA